MSKNQQPAQAAVLLDLDGVLCENTFLREYGDVRDYALFARRCPNAVANMDFICFARALKLDKIAVFILTARSENLRTNTMAWLKEKGVSVDKVLMRPKGDKTADHLLKKKMLSVLRKEESLGKPGGPVPLMAVDDDEQVVRMYKQEGIPAFFPSSVPEIWV